MFNQVVTTCPREAREACDAYQHSLLKGLSVAISAAISRALFEPILHVFFATRM